MGWLWHLPGVGLLKSLSRAVGLGAGAAHLSVGQTVPDAGAPDETGRLRTLAEFRGAPLVVFFYPRDFTAG